MTIIPQRHTSGFTYTADRCSYLQLWCEVTSLRVAVRSNRWTRGRRSWREAGRVRALMSAACFDPSAALSLKVMDCPPSSHWSHAFPVEVNVQHTIPSFKIHVSLTVLLLPLMSRQIKSWKAPLRLRRFYLFFVARVAFFFHVSLSWSESRLRGIRWKKRMKRDGRESW